MSNQKVTFLLVDDQEPNLLALEGLLKRDGLELLKASSGKDALELLLCHDVDLAFLDVQMPEMNGFELAELMRGTERTRYVPIIFLTAGAVDQQWRFRGYETGAVDFLFKPIEPHVLQSKAGVFFDLARQRKELRFAAEENARLLAALRLTQQELQQHATKLERTVDERTARLRDTIAQLETFSYSITHDMRGPLRAMNSFAQLLKAESGEKLDKDGQEYLRRIIDGAGRMDRLIQDVLQYSRVARENLPLEPVNIDQLLRDVVSQYPDIVEQREHIDLGESCGESVIIGNPAALTQAISNLLSNALKFVPRGRAPQVRVRCEERDRHIRFTVQDNGIGIAREHHEQIFGVFQRLHTSEYPGTGIGLSIVKKAVERMNGTMGLESEPGQGSQFWVELPKAKLSANAPAAVVLQSESKR